MNRIYRIVWNHVTHTWTAVAENAKGRGKPGSSRKMKLLALAVSAALLPSAAQAVALLPTLTGTSGGAGTVTLGSATSSNPATNVFTINQTTQNLAINWNTFNIGAAETLNFVQPNASSIALNRVTTANPSSILGNLNANGQVFILNPNGVLFGSGAQVNVGSLVASTLSLSDANLNTGTPFVFTGTAGNVTNQGTLTAANGGYVALLAPTVLNQGTITTPSGTALLAAGNQVTLSLSGSSLLNYTVDVGAVNALADNQGTIHADGGQVYLNAQAANALTVGVVNNTGIIQARSINNVGGVIRLTGGAQANLGGTLDASPLTGTATGTIQASAVDVNVSKALNWSNSPLTLTAQNNINVNASMTGSNAAQLELDYGQAAVAAGNTNTYNINAPVNLDAGQNFRTKQGSDGAVKNYTVITALGAAGSTTGTDLQGINGNLAGNYVLGGNIDATGMTGFVPIGNGSAFVGTFDGLGHAINNLNISGTLNVGLFGTVTGAALRNVGLVGGSVTGQFYVGGLVGYNNGTVSNSYATGNVNGTHYVGGLVGWNNGGSTISNSYATGGVVGTGSYVGGLAGWNYGGAISNSHASGNVTGLNNIGGLVGRSNTGSTITNTYATGSVTTTAAAGSNNNFFGGLVGYNGGSITNAYATGTVNGMWQTGGLVGLNWLGTVSNTYATGAVSGSNYVGGLLGRTVSGSVSNSYATGQVTGTIAGHFGGLVGGNVSPITNSFWDTVTSGLTNGFGTNFSSFGATGLTTAQALTQASYTGFDFANTWYMVNGSTRPFLRSEYSTTITNAHQLQLMGMNLAGSYTLANNIDLAAELANPSGMWGTASATVATGVNTGFAPIAGNAISGASGFAGTFDGLGHTISNLSINRPTTDHVGLFGMTSTGAVLRNVGMVGGSVTGRVVVGGLVGYNYGAVSNSYTTGSVSGTSNVGGLLGYNLNGTVSNSYATGNVNGANMVGGLLGFSNGSISNSYATGNVSGTSRVGGLMGTNYGAVSNSYATGSVSGTSMVGGLVGFNYGGTVSNSFWDTVTTGRVSGFGFGSGGATGLTTTQMHNMSSFTGWNIANTGGSSAVWRVYEGQSNPLLRSFLTPLALADVSSKYNGAAQTGNGAGLSNLTAATGTNVGNYTAFSNQQGYDISGGNLNITPAFAILNLTGSRAYDGTNIVNANIFTMSGLAPNETLTMTGAGTVADKNVGTGKTVTLGTLTLGNGTGGGLASNYTLVGGTHIADITQAPLAFSGTPTAVNKVYDANTVASITGYTLSGVANGETLNVSASFADKNVGTAKPVTVGLNNGTGANAGLTSNYSYTLPTGLAANITPATITVIGLPQAASRVYDGTTNATVSGGIVNGIKAGDAVAVSGKFADKNVGTNKALTLTLSGLDAANYIINNAAPNLTASITARVLSVSVFGSNRVYNGGTNATVSVFTNKVVGDVVNASYTSASYADKNVGVNKVITVAGLSISGADAGNYTLRNTTATGTGGITAANLYVTGVTAANKVYDGTTAATLLGTASITPMGTDVLALGGVGTGVFSSANIANNVPVTVTGYTLGGADAGNYILRQPMLLKANITIR